MILSLAFHEGLADSHGGATCLVRCSVMHKVVLRVWWGAVPCMRWCNMFDEVQYYAWGGATCLVPTYLYLEWPHRQGGCFACCCCTFDSAEVHWFILCTRRSGSTANEGGGCDQSIGSTVSDAIVRSWLWLTATKSSPVGCFSALLKVVDNRPHFLW